ncbi:hypothetical protein GCM10007424_23770 [Flavobacterium suaedae]|uniref:Uncharacterized protein n=1 Tax=Flavobacterium suaedae TaxID=1767027 RepID=A0ABQ1K3N3_9FLAO|nr:hypothetical protein [Flavobacterium suaedae]GGB82994.1 hypothetical protein GCM10007424_23770 [Flavobacterium suaedae]
MKDKVFESNPKLQHYFKTADGQAFYNEPDAKNHAKTLTDKTVTPVNRADYNSEETPKEVIKIYVEEAVELIEKAETLEDIKKFENDKRVTVKAAYEARKKEFEESVKQPQDEKTD